jgi:hypothetical protein
MTDVLQDPLLWREYSKELGDFLSERLGIEPDDLPRSNGWAGSGNSIGALALRLGVLTLDQIEQVVDLQASDGQLFGELAKHLGFCTDKDIHRLLAMQRLYRCLDQTALLVIDGRFEVADLLRHLADFAAEGGIE